jgi:hypothetical protein
MRLEHGISRLLMGYPAAEKTRYVALEHRDHPFAMP